MGVELRRCRKCSCYTMKASCPVDGSETGTAHPPKYSPQDKWARYRRNEKYPELSAAG